MEIVSLDAARAAGSLPSRKGWPVDISREWNEAKLAAGVCEVSGLPFDFSGDTNNPVEYIRSNWILWVYNVAFFTWGENVYRSFAKALLSNRPPAVDIPALKGGEDVKDNQANMRSISLKWNLEVPNAI